MKTKVKPTVEGWERDKMREKFIDEVRPYFANAIMQGENGDELREDDLAGDYAKSLWDEYVSHSVQEAKAEDIKLIESDELIERQERWLSKSLETVEYNMAMDALRNYQRDLLSTLITKKTK